MRQPKLTAMAVTALLSGMTLTACASESESSTDSSDEGVSNIFFANPLPAYPDWAAADTCFTQALEDNGIEGTTQGPTGLQMQDQFVLDRISQAITSGQYDGIVMAPIQPAKYEPFIERAKDADMKVATIQLPASGTDFTVGTDVSEYGASVAEAIGSRKGEQNVIVITDAAGGIGDPFIKAFEDNLPANVTVVATGYDAGDPNKTLSVVNQSLAAHPEANVVWSWEGTAVAGMTTAIKEKGLEGEVVAVTNDLTEQVVDGIQDDLIFGTFQQHFCDMGRMAVENLIKLGDGEDVATMIDTGTTFVTAENLDATLAETKAAQE